MPKRTEAEAKARQLADAMEQLKAAEAARERAAVAVSDAVAALRSVVGNNVAVQFGDSVFFCRDGCSAPTVVPLVTG